MSRRGTPQIIGLVAAAVLLVYGFYAYHDVKSALLRSEELVKRSKAEQENLSTQLQTANEQKLHLESSIQKEREQFKNSKDELLRSKAELESKCKEDKRVLAEKVSSLNEETKQIKANYEVIQMELQRHRDSDTQHEEERVRLASENKRLKQESDNEIAVLRDEVANLKRQNTALQAKLGGSQQKVNSLQQANINNQIPQMVPGLQQDTGNVNDKFDIPMQINKPGDHERKPYFEPKEAKPDHPLNKRAAAPVVADVAVAAGAGGDRPGIQGQVAPPDVGNDQNEVIEQQDPLKRGAKVRVSDNDSAGRLRNPAFPVDVDRARVGREVNQLHDGNVKVGAFDDSNVNLHHQEHKQLQIAEPQHEEENQLQGPQNERNGDEKDDNANGDDNEEDYQYEDKKDKADADADKVQNDGPHAGPVDEDDIAKEGGL
jgi:outer membrane murein-binding lipoprotein Lpp